MRSIGAAASPSGPVPGAAPQRRCCEPGPHFEVTLGRCPRSTGELLIHKTDARGSTVVVPPRSRVARKSGPGAIIALDLWNRLKCEDLIAQSLGPGPCSRVPRKSFKDDPQIGRRVNCCYETVRKRARPAFGPRRFCGSGPSVADWLGSWRHPATGHHTNAALTELAVGSERRFCFATKRGGSAGRTGPCVVLGRAGPTSAQQAHDLSAVHPHRHLAPYYLEPYFWLVFAHDGGNLG